MAGQPRPAPAPRPRGRDVAPRIGGRVRATPFTRGTLTPTTPRLSSRDLFPGPNALTAQSAAGRNANVAGKRHALTPLGPGNKSRDDSGDRKRTHLKSRQSRAYSTQSSAV